MILCYTIDQIDCSLTNTCGYAFDVAGSGTDEEFDKCMHSKAHAKWANDPKNAAGATSCFLFFCFEGGANPFTKDDGNFDVKQLGTKV